jgi:hypothetical protein
VQIAPCQGETRGETNYQVTEEDSQQAATASGGQESQPEASAGYDSYRSLADSSVIIFVPKHTVPPLRFKAGGWELLQTSVDLNPDARARVAEEGYLIETADSVSSTEVVSSDFTRPIEPVLEVEFALVVARMIDSVSNSPEDMRQVIYDLARYKLQEQLLQTKAEEREHTQRALEVAIRGVEAFSEKNADIRPREHQPQLNGPGFGSADHEWIPRVAPSPHPDAIPQPGPSLRLRVERNTGGSANKPRWSYSRRTVAMIIILVAILILVAIQQRERLQYLAFSSPKLELKTTLEEHSARSQVSNSVVSASPPAKSATLRPTDYGVYAVSNEKLFDLSPLPGRPSDIRIAVSPALTTPSRTILPDGHPRFIVFSRDIASSTPDRAEVRIIAKIAREFSASVAGKKVADDAWVVRNISFPFRSSPVNGNPEMHELHSEDPALELTPGRYALVLKTQAYDFSVQGKVVDPRQCLERIVGSTGVFYSDCKNP